MELFFTNQINDTFLLLSEDESRHCIRVLRKNTGETVQVIDGKGHLIEGVLEIESKNKPAKVWIKSKTEFNATEFKSGFHLAIAPTKNADRMEWLIEKTVELGIGSITFLQCDNSERTNIRLDRLEKIAISALKQSKQYWLPQISMAVPFKEYIRKFAANERGYIAHCHDGEKVEFGMNNLKSPCHIMIGPEGDFSQAEVELAINKGIIPVSLGKSRLRTETAGFYACGVYRGTEAV